jgi:hypothetical protein
MWSFLSSIISNIYIEYFDKLTLVCTQHTLSLWFRYVDGAFAVWSHGPDQLQEFHQTPSPSKIKKRL